MVLRRNKFWPLADLRNSEPFQITYEAGYGDKPSMVPEVIRLVIRQYAQWMYEHRGEYEGQMMLQMPLPGMAMQLLQPYKVLRLGGRVL